MAQIRACTVCSGSSANAVYIEIGENAILIDAGCTEKNLTAFLREINSSYDKIKAVFVTHEHCDHIKAVPGLTKQSDVADGFRAQARLRRVFFQGTSYGLYRQKRRF